MIEKLLVRFWEAFISAAFSVIIITWLWHWVVFVLALMLDHNLGIGYGLVFAAHHSVYLRS